MTEQDPNTVTALDYIEKQEQLEKEAQSILPGKFEKCTFPLGYVRQSLYACKTCSSESEEPAGMCYSCSIACHASHELFELFPKRAFRCDCGIKDKFAGHHCSLTIPAKKIIQANDKNTYNHNFQGRYCRCDQHYDPEKEEGTMYQCIACEDWFHETCIGDIPDAIDDFECYVCRDCTKKYPFLMNGKDERFSLGLSKNKDPISKWILPPSQISAIDVVSVETKPETAVKEDSTTCPDQKADPTSAAPVPTINLEGSSETLVKEEPEPVSTDVNNHDGSSGILSTKEIKIETVPTEITSHENGSTETSGIGEKRKHEDIIPNTFKRAKTEAGCENVDISLLPEHDNIEIFLQEGWREGLCKCTKCMADYKTHHVEYLLAEEKTFEPEEDEDAGKSLLEVGMEQLQRVDRVQALESLMAYKSLADDIKTYLEAFKDSGKVVTKQDIDAFFDAKRRERQERE
ncbi:uncharacterized protein EV154DRAFT_527785 [Mucor mucedo]|uniref:uncharacterized protein n=1 Tax=Mucor mucedo TaxID=29922 RepID=UPI00221FD2DA|nr:uncharacterized protein EV154DRAFT_527785 [Mucor mucedo]KAI7873702.1 hypothetical protein EV154DRAFT_527785 [Mucor mucedo]